ncbi:unnamed protein product [Gongylonema pulchrum]|uniref:Uncharacterized protein n=1 Tax=Gongylonema pulchrum TaxID=637853 RepID=A0A3P7MPP9_9BILA|nr:unnamed protein product [Gongylonema pulchrum]
MNMHNVAGLFIILGLGLIFAFCTVIVEFCIRSRQLAHDEQKPFWQEVLEELRFALNISKVHEHRTRRNLQQDSQELASPSAQLL